MGEFFFIWRIIYGGVKCMCIIGKFIKGITGKEEVNIDLKEERLEGNVLDVSLDNQGIIYNIYKNNKEDLKVDYIESNDKIKSINDAVYDTAAFFFTLGNLGLERHIKDLLEEVTSYLKEDGHVVIWDIEKNRGKYINLKLNILLPDNMKKTVNIKNHNLFKKCSCNRIKELLQKDFDIIEFTSTDNIYYIKGRKKGRTRDESNTDSG